MKCKHKIGIWYDYDDTDIITIDCLKEKINDIKKLNEYKKQAFLYEDTYLEKEYTLEDYFNKKKRCDNFQVFNYCPYCGKEIKLESVK